MEPTRDLNAQGIVPAHLSLLAIYNPTLGSTDETFRDQIVFYFSHDAQKRKRRGASTESLGNVDAQKEENEKLRQIGLAQGMVNFAKTFSNGRPLDHIDTEKTRIVARELEPNWWIIASINLTTLPLTQTPSKAPANGKGGDTTKLEYSSREVTPPALLLEQIERAHSVFLLHAGSSLSHLFARLGRTKFCALLDRFWTKFSITWDIMLHGSPAVDIFGGMKLAAGGELGMGVGEEEWGSGEREVLEDFVRRTDGLVDIVVSRFGSPQVVEKEAETSKGKSDKAKPPVEPWMGVGRLPQASDGVVFSGMGIVSRSSLRDISHWISSLYTHGDAAFGARDSPTSDRKRRKRAARVDKRTKSASKDATARSGIPPSIVSSAEKSLNQAAAKVDKAKTEDSSKSKHSRTKSHNKAAAPGTAASESPYSFPWAKYLTVGYGTAWTLPDFDASELFSGRLSPEEVEENMPVDALQARIDAHIAQENNGYFVIGLRGDPEDDSDETPSTERQGETEGDAADWNKRIMLRTLHINPSPATSFAFDAGSTTSSIALLSPALSTPGLDTEFASKTTPFSHQADTNTTHLPKRRRLRIVVYAQRPFIYVLLFNPLSASLMMPPFYRQLHTFLAPLRDLLGKRTGGAVGNLRRRGFLHEPDELSNQKSDVGDKDVFEVLFEEESMAIVSSLPCIPQVLPSLTSDGGDAANPGYQKRDMDLPPSWTRAEALNVHSAALDILASNSAVSTAGAASVRSDSDPVERSVKTGRGWWVVWGRLSYAVAPLSSALKSALPMSAAGRGGGGSVRSPMTPERARRASHDAQDYFSSKMPSSSVPPANTQVILVRRAQAVDSKGKARVTSAWHLGALGGAASEAGKMLDASRFGIGFDARKYMESIVRLGR